MIYKYNFDINSADLYNIPLFIISNIKLSGKILLTFTYLDLYLFKYTLFFLFNHLAIFLFSITSHCTVLLSYCSYPVLRINTHN